MPAPDSPTLDLVLTAVLAASVVLAGGVPFALARGRERRLDRALRGADVAALTRQRSRAGKLPPSLPAALERATDGELRLLGDAALASRHPSAAALFDLVFEIVERRRAREQEEERRRERWRRQSCGPAEEPTDAGRT